MPFTWLEFLTRAIKATPEKNTLQHFFLQLIAALGNQIYNYLRHLYKILIYGFVWIRITSLVSLCLQKTAEKHITPHHHHLWVNNHSFKCNAPPSWN